MALYPLAFLQDAPHWTTRIANHAFSFIFLLQHHHLPPGNRRYEENESPPLSLVDDYKLSRSRGGWGEKKEKKVHTQPSYRLLGASIKLHFPAHLCSFPPASEVSSLAERRRGRQAGGGEALTGT